MSASNTRDCFRECIGLTVRGVLFNALPMGRADLASGTKTLVFDNGTGLTIASNGSFWREDAREVRRAIDCQKEQLAHAEREIRDVLALAGEARDA